MITSFYTGLWASYGYERIKTWEISKSKSPATIFFLNTRFAPIYDNVDKCLQTWSRGLQSYYCNYLNIYRVSYGNHISIVNYVLSFTYRLRTLRFSNAVFRSLYYQTDDGILCNFSRTSATGQQVLYPIFITWKRMTLK